MISRPSRVVIMVSMEVSQFCPPALRERRETVLRPVAGAALDFLAAEAVFDLAAERASAGSFIDLVAVLELPIALGCARLGAADDFDVLRDRVEDCPVDFRPVREGVF
jgi:hypothetical protein